MASLPIHELMRQYTEFERRNFVSSFHRRDVHDGVIRFISDSSEGSCILHHEFDGGDEVAEIIAEQIASFNRLRKNFEWKVYGTDEPVTLGAELIRQGFIEGPAESFMVLDLQSAPNSLIDSSPHDVRRVSDRAGIAQAVSVQENIWRESMDDRIEALATELEHSPENLSVYIICSGDNAVSSAWITFNPGSPFAGLWGGSTLPEYRTRGCYHALLAQRAREAISRGVRFLTIDASPMSRPIVARLGFQWITETRPYEWRMQRPRRG